MPIRGIYEEVHMRIQRGVPDPLPEFPDTCPECGAAKDETHKSNFYRPVRYECGGTFDIKPQIQNHTDKWWGSCPTKEAERKRYRDEQLYLPESLRKTELKAK